MRAIGSSDRCYCTPPLEAQVPSTGAWASLTSQHRCHVAARFLLAYADCGLIIVAFPKARESDTSTPKERHENPLHIRPKAR